MRPIPLYLKISLAGIILNLLIFGLGWRYIQYQELDYFWNKGHLRMKDMFSGADRIVVRNELQRNAIIAKIEGPEKVAELLDLVKFERAAPVSFWKIPMLPKDYCLDVSFCMDAVRVWFIRDNREIGFFWVTPSCRELYFSPTIGSLEEQTSRSETWTLTEDSFHKIALWFLSYDMKHYVENLNAIPPRTNPPNTAIAD